MTKSNTDILLDDDMDLKFENGDFAVGNAFWQDIQIIMSLTKGSLRSDPVLGPDLILLKNKAISKTEIIKRIKLNLQRDNKQVSIKIIDGKIVIQ